VLVDAMGRAGWDIPPPPATMFAWAPLPEPFKELGSLEFSKLLIDEAGVAVAPGIGFGEHGEGYVRIGLVENEQRIRQAARNIRRMFERRGLVGPAEGEVACNDMTKVAIAGLGTVGVGVVKMLHAKSAELGAKLGKKVALVGVCARSSKDRGVDLSGVEFFTDAQEMIRTCAPDIFVELIGGSEGPALEAVTHALQSGIHVVTANKALIAVHGAELARLAETSGAGLRFEAAVAGGIPIIKALQEGLIGNQVIRVAGILNGTCNYILSAMDKTGDEFQVMLGKAQALGYAEADPTFDVDGIDAAHKIAILASCAFGTIPRFDQVDIEGIRGVTSDDINYARELGYRLKLLGIDPTKSGGLRATCAFGHGA
jgi:Homoserine dehydrogenase